MSATTLGLRDLEQTLFGAWSLRRDTPPMARGEGCELWDTEGNRYLDLTAAYGVASLGHCHPEVVAAVREQVERLMTCGPALYSEARARFLGALQGVLPTHLERVFLSNSGTEANEAALKLARVATGRTRFVALKGAFHGRTLGSLSLTWNPQIRQAFEPLLEGVERVSPNDTGALERALDDQVAALLVEVIQGESGVRPCDSEYLMRAQALCRERGVLLVVDEVQTGFGRTGSWFAHHSPEHGLELEPDMVTMAKGIGGGFPLGAVAYTAAIGDALFPGAHGSTFGGNPLACAAGRAVIETLTERDLPRRAAEVGGELLGRLEETLGKRTVVREIRGRGLMVGIDLREKAGKYVAALTAKHRVLVLPGGATALRLLPPLVVEESQLEEGVAALAEVLPS